ncbi:ATPase [Devosia yakushimensis]|uniref:ATPase n=1 Tax=Devosia yakushimensis TaxID=470028 RepID=A0ABQ5UB20_9HYPH|nr:AAA family ATPase [Devosia yakushimensis]GLQ08502.1 ATPase [Devosia yakushimensis]
MGLTDIHIAGYRSVRSIYFPVRQLSVLVGANGVGKTNLYRGLELVQSAATGTLALDIARDGGLGSVFWAGERKAGEAPRLVLSVSLEDVGSGPHNYSLELGFAPSYEIEIGFRVPTAAAFPLEAQIKAERLTLKQGPRPVVLMERKQGSVWARDNEGRRVLADDNLLASETALSALRGYPEIDAVRETLSAWRFFHSFRTDATSPIRRPGLAVAAPFLDANGSNLAAVFATLRHIRQDTVDLDHAIEDAFPGAQLDVPVPEENASFTLTFPDMPKRAFGAAELSDGTLQFLALMGALLSYRLPPLIALNEPESSLHPELLPALARVIAKAAERSQVWVVTHSTVLSDAIAAETGILPREVIRKNGGTWLEGLSQVGVFADD